LKNEYLFGLHSNNVVKRLGNFYVFHSMFRAADEINGKSMG